jgi:hypothetical protein
MILVIWNVLSLHKPGALAKLKDELSKYGVAIAAVQEIRWCGCEIFESGDFTVATIRGNLEQGLQSIKKHKHFILDFSPGTDRICTLWIKGKFFNTTIICAHEPTEEKDEMQKDAFYENLERIYMKVPKHDTKL